MRITCADGAQGIGYTYTIGTGGSSVVALLRDHLAPRLIGRDAGGDRGDLARPAVRHARHQRRRDHQPGAGGDRHRAVGPALPARRRCRCGRRQAARKQRMPVYTTEGGWLHHRTDTLVRETVAAQEAGFKGAKLKVGKPHVGRRRGAAARGARGGGRRLRDHGRCQPVLHAWARRCGARRATPSSASPGSRSRCRPTTSPAMCELAARATMPIAVGESLYSPGAVRATTSQRGACSIVQVDVRAHRRHHAVAQGGASGRGAQPRGVPALPDGAARLAVARRCRTRPGSSTSRSSMRSCRAAWTSSRAALHRRKHRVSASNGTGRGSKRVRASRWIWDEARVSCFAGC